MISCPGAEGQLEDFRLSVFQYETYQITTDYFWKQESSLKNSLQ